MTKTKVQLIHNFRRLLLSYNNNAILRKTQKNPRSGKELVPYCSGGHLPPHAPHGYKPVIGKQIKSCKNYGKIKCLEETCILHLFLACLFIFPSLALEDDDEMTSNALFSLTLRFEINVPSLVNFSMLFQPPDLIRALRLLILKTLTFYESLISFSLFVSTIYITFHRK